MTAREYHGPPGIKVLAGMIKIEVCLCGGKGLKVPELSKLHFQIPLPFQMPDCQEETETFPGP